MPSSGTSTPAGDSPGPGRAFLRTTDFTPEIVPPRLRRTTYPAGQSPLVLPGLTRASSSFTITSNHQNILPLWPAAPPPGQPVVFFLSAVRRPSGLPFFSPAAWSVQGGEGRDSPVPWSMRPALPDTGQGRGIFPFRVPVFEGAAALRPVRSRNPGHQGSMAFVCGALRCARCPAGFGRPGVAASLRPYAHRSWPGCSCSPAITDGTAHVCSRKFAVPLFLILLSYHGGAVRCPPAVRQGSGKAHTGRIARGNPAAQKKTPTGMETGGRLESFYGCGARDQNSL